MRFATLVAVTLLAALASCRTRPDPRTVETELQFGRIWTEMVETAGLHGFRPDTAETDRGLRRFVSIWREAPAPFGYGRRTRFHADVFHPEDKPEIWVVEFWVEQQKVTDIARGFEPREDDWGKDGQDRDREDVIYGQLRQRLGQEIGVRPSYERQKR